MNKSRGKHHVIFIPISDSLQNHKVVSSIPFRSQRYQDPVFSKPWRVSPAQHHMLANQQRSTVKKVDPLHFLVTQLQSQIPQEVLGRGPTASRDTELFYT